MTPEKEKRAMELLPRIEEMEKALVTGLTRITQAPLTIPLPLFYLHLGSDDTVRPTPELCEALKGKTDDDWAKKTS